MINNNPLISIVIPAHNVEHTIGESIKSVLDQTYDNWELIIVENGSTDHTVQVSERYARENPKIHLTYSDLGVCNARNKGVHQAQGQWVCFLDADDQLLPHILQSCVFLLEDTVDLYVFAHTSRRGENENKNVGIEHMDCNAAKCKMLSNPTQYMTAWGKMLRREVLEQKNVIFDTELTLAEDAEFMFRYLKGCREVVFMQETGYIYTLSDESTVRTYKEGITEMYLKSLYKTHRAMKDESKTVKLAFAEYVQAHILLSLVHDIYNVNNPADKKEKKRKLIELCHDPLCKRCIQKANIKGGVSIRTIPILCMKYKLYEVAKLIVIIRIKQNQMRYERGR